MRNLWLENIFRYVVLLLLQVLLFNNLHLFGLCTPCVYVLFLIALPTTLPRWAELLIGFTAGLILDIFCNTLGVQMVACTLLAYMRPLLISNTIQDNDRLIGTPDSKSLGWFTYFRIVTILVVVHHTVMFSLIAFSLHNWWLTLIEILLSSVISIALILGIDFLKQ